jgi:hypothetical protein
MTTQEFMLLRELLAYVERMHDEANALSTEVAKLHTNTIEARHKIRLLIKEG